MNKIICDVCGSVYPESAENCPICGYSQREYSNQPEEDFLADSPIQNRADVLPDSFSDLKFSAEEEIYSDAPQTIPEYDDDDDFEDDEVYTERRSSVPASTFVIILLVIIITLLLLAIGILFFGFYLPAHTEKPVPTQPAQNIAVTEPIQEETTEPSIPCTSLVLTSGVTELTKEGQYWLLHVTVLPEDTTDTLTFVSEDESVVTVNEHGRLTAVGEGETTVYISCGDKEIKCKVVVQFKEEDVSVPEEQQHTPDAVEHETLPEELNDAAEPAQTEEETEASPETTASDEIILKLEKTDVSSNVKGVSFELRLDCDLKPEDVTWFTMDSKIAIVKNGIVTTVGAGQTKIVAQYNDQQVSCTVRCNF